jgi:hypothetical protein
LTARDDTTQPCSSTFDDTTRGGTTARHDRVAQLGI